MSSMTVQVGGVLEKGSGVNFRGKDFLDVTKWLSKRPRAILCRFHPL